MRSQTDRLLYEAVALIGAAPFPVKLSARIAFLTVARLLRQSGPLKRLILGGLRTFPNIAISLEAAYSRHVVPENKPDHCETPALFPENKPDHCETPARFPENKPDHCETPARVISDEPAEIVPVRFPRHIDAYKCYGGRATIKSIIVFKVDHVGDLILALDALFVLRRTFPEATLTLVCGPWNLPIARSLEIFDHIYGLEFFSCRADGPLPQLSREKLGPLVQDRFDLAVDLRADDDTRILLSYVDATYKCGYQSDIYKGHMTLSLPRPDISAIRDLGAHQSLLMLRLAHTISDFFRSSSDVGAALREKLVDLERNERPFPTRKRFVALNTASGRAVKNWPVERFAALADWLCNEVDVGVVLIGTQDQCEDALAISDRCRSANLQSMVGRTTINEAVSLVSQADLYIGNDSGLTHVAARIGVPTVAIYSGIDPTVVWVPVGENVTVLSASTPCSPCHIRDMVDCNRERICLTAIDVESVKAAVREKLAHLRVEMPDVASRGGDQKRLNGHSCLTDTGTSVPKGSGCAVEDVAAKLGAGCQVNTRRLIDTSLSGTRERIRRLAIGLNSMAPPRRYSDNSSRYHKGGGIVSLMDDAGVFLKGESNQRDIARFYAFCLVFDQLKKEDIAGNCAELGVYKGDMADVIVRAARKLGKTTYLLDTFEGFNCVDLRGIDSGIAMDFGDTSMEAVRSRIGDASVRYVKGYFPTSASQLPNDEKYSLVHLDCDLYAPMLSGLEYFYDRMVPGGYLLMHDYGSLDWPGVEKAIDEFFADKPESVITLPDDAGTAIVRKMTPLGHSDNWIMRQELKALDGRWLTVSDFVFSRLLRTGWAQPEEWGVWGVGGQHEMHISLPFAPQGALLAEMECEAVLIGSRHFQTVDVTLNDSVIAAWTFTRGNNRSRRNLRFSADLVAKHCPVLKIQFRPHFIGSPKELEPSETDARQLGLGVRKIRLNHSVE